VRVFEPPTTYYWRNIVDIAYESIDQVNRTKTIACLKAWEKLNEK